MMFKKKKFVFPSSSLLGTFVLLVLLICMIIVMWCSIYFIYLQRL
ncbi:MAG: hypothetical protein ABF649_09815 [Bacillus sp. (in: firmicutes)]